MPGGTDNLDVASLNAQYTHLAGRRVELDVNGGVDWAFSSDSGARPIVSGIQIAQAQPAFIYYQAGARLGYRLNRTTTADFFVNGILAQGDRLQRPRRIWRSLELLADRDALGHAGGGWTSVNLVGATTGRDHSVASAPLAPPGSGSQFATVNSKLKLEDQLPGRGQTSIARTSSSARSGW